MRNPLVIEGEYYIPSEAVLPEIEKVTLKHEGIFAVLDERGEAPMVYEQELGLYFRDTRYLDTWELSVNGESLTFLASQALAHGRAQLFTLTNKDVVSLDTGERLRRETFLFNRMVMLDRHRAIELLEVRNYDHRPHTLEIQRRARSNFNDIFEVRGHVRGRRGIVLPPQTPRGEAPGGIACLSYEGLDGKAYRTYVWANGGDSSWQVEGGLLVQGQRVLVPPRGSVSLRLIVSLDALPDPIMEGLSVESMTVATGLSLLGERPLPATAPPFPFPELTSDNQIMNKAFLQAGSDIMALLTVRCPQRHVAYPDAGIPWFCAPFGRDGIITAYQLMPWGGRVAKSVLTYCFDLLGVKDDPFTDEEPGKVFHELREGEMARTREVPFIPYYGSVDATPLCLILLGEYMTWVGDVAFLEAHWEKAAQAARFIMRRLAEDPRGFLSYQRRAETGLVNQGWKDSHDSIMHRDGKLAKTPIALCEVQAYAFRALRTMAALARTLGRDGDGETWGRAADALAERFRRHFWDEERGYVYLALDGEGQACQVMASNQGHCLWCGILSQREADRIADHLLANEMFTGFGVRTLGRAEVAYNPLSYHNGSVWPHDNSLIAMGLRAYGREKELVRLAAGILRVLENAGDGRLPELFCGFDAISGGGGPIPYAVACKPQAWAAGSLFLFARALLGIEPGPVGGLTFRRPVLPPQLQSLRVRGLWGERHEADLVIRQGSRHATVEILGKAVGFDVAVIS